MKALHFVIAAALVLAVVCEGRADFVLSGVEHMDVTSYHGSGELWDSSTASVMTGGDVSNLSVNDNSSVAVLDGSFVSGLVCNGSSTATVSGGVIAFADARERSSLDISGGQIIFGLSASGTSTITFHGTDFVATNGLSLDGQTVLGSGWLTGKWFDGTTWGIGIGQDPGATIQAVPEPATLSLLALGGLAMVRRRRRRA